MRARNLEVLRDPRLVSAREQWFDRLRGLYAGQRQETAFVLHGIQRYTEDAGPGWERWLDESLDGLRVLSLDFAGAIYGGRRNDVPIPADAPPLFILCAADDAMAAPASTQLYSDWRAAGHSAELHIYSAGGHGFGMQVKGLPSDTWIERFGDWLGVQGLLAPNG